MSLKKLEGTGTPKWRARVKFPVQAGALIITVAGSFMLYWALETGHDLLAAIVFGTVALSFALTIWIS
ncbi:MAG TPA: hypothetical protein PK801_09760 [Aggregatilineales bacterium]|nr:hypothetical protein [Chloroflexota bacterium]HOA24492.1 hypothetical protein [Aggregatilineales bacterium]HPV06247.1 hypothetical protein [Aggregatilineales bacterium]HQA68598.1 hypothetical protein [Aggregatilineales bacterium]HQE19031.1 hypothetical protein [Aggregatilineales bacterium]